MTDSLVSALRGVVGDAHVLTDPDMLPGYDTDWLGRRPSVARCVVRPGTVDEVAQAVRECVAAGAAIVPQGGNTGLVDGSVPRRGEVVLSTRRLTRLDPVSHAAMQVTAGAGVTIETLQQHARDAGLDFAVDWGARASATVGGAVSTNAGGSRVVRFGTMRAQVLGVQAVLADGSVITQLGGLPKETAGPPLHSVFVGSEGTLGVVTAARLRLVPWYRSTAAALVACDSIDDAVALLPALRSMPSLDAVELLLPEALEVSCAYLGIAPPVATTSAAAFVMVDCAAHTDPAGELASVVGERRGVMALGPQRDLLYRIRDNVTTGINRRGVPLKLDVAVPVTALAELVRVTRAAVADSPGAELVVFGHLADSNLHIEVIGPPPDDSSIDARVLAKVASCGGSISAEHGVGRHKAPYLSLCRSSSEIATMRAIKSALDPRSLMAPGVIFEA